MKNRMNDDYCQRMIYTINRKYNSSKKCNYIYWCLIIGFLILSIYNIFFTVYSEKIGFFLSLFVMMVMFILNEKSKKDTYFAAELSDDRDVYILYDKKLSKNKEEQLKKLPLIEQRKEDWYRLESKETDAEKNKFSMFCENVEFEAINIRKLKKKSNILLSVYVLLFIFIACFIPTITIMFFYLGYYLWVDIGKISRKENITSLINSYIEMHNDTGMDIKYINEKILKLQSENRRINIHLPELSFIKYNKKLEGEING